MRRTTIAFVAASALAGLAFAPIVDGGGWTGPSEERLADPLAYLDGASTNPGPLDLVESVDNVPAGFLCRPYVPLVTSVDAPDQVPCELDAAPIQNKQFNPAPVFSFDFDEKLVGTRHPSIPDKDGNPDGGKIRGGNAGDHGTFMEFYTREFEGETIDVAIQGVNDIGALLWDVTDPTQPELLSIINCGYHQVDVGMYELEDGRWIAVLGADDVSDHEDCIKNPGSPYFRGFTLAAGSGQEVMAFFDVTDLRKPKALSAVGTSITATGGSHTIEMQGNAPIAYIVTALDPRLEIVDFSDPEKPVITGPLETLGNPHAFRVSDDGTRGYSAGSFMQTLSIHDLTDPYNPAPIGVSAAPRNLYTHESLPSHDKSFVLVMDEGGYDPGYDQGVCPGTGFWLYDLTVETSPVPLSYTVADIDGLTGTDGTGSGPTACAVHYGNINHSDDTLTVAYYGAGVRVFDLSDPLDPNEVGALMFEDSDVWTAKSYRDGRYVFVSDLSRGFEVYEWLGEQDLADRAD